MQPISPRPIIRPVVPAHGDGPRPWRTDADFCIEALEEALSRHGRPGIFNTDQGSQSTSPRFPEIRREAGIRISMDGRGRWIDTIFIEQFWHSLKYECICLNAFETGSEARAGTGRWMRYYNAERPLSSLSGRTPDEAHAGAVLTINAAA